MYISIISIGYIHIHTYIYIYTRIFARVPRALDSPVTRDRGPNPLCRFLGLRWQTSCRAAKVTLDKAHVMTHRYSREHRYMPRRERQSNGCAKCVYCNRKKYPFNAEHILVAKGKAFFRKTPPATVGAIEKCPLRWKRGLQSKNM